MLRQWRNEHEWLTSLLNYQKSSKSLESTRLAPDASPNLQSGIFFSFREPYRERGVNYRVILASHQSVLLISCNQEDFSHNFDNYGEKPRHVRGKLLAILTYWTSVCAKLRNRKLFRHQPGLRRIDVESTSIRPTSSHWGSEHQIWRSNTLIPQVTTPS